MRDLTPEECEFIAGGKMARQQLTLPTPETPPDIVVTHSPPPPPPPPYYPPSPPPPSLSPAPTGGPPGGTPGSTPNPMAPYKVGSDTDTCGQASGAAVEAAQHVMGNNAGNTTGAMKTSTGHTWQNVEFSTIIVQNSSGRFGALDSAIYSEDKVGASAVPVTMPSNAVGTWHNHPLRGDATQQQIDMFPSQADWDVLQSIADQHVNANPAMFITDGAGVTREFDLSEKASLYNMTNQQLGDPANKQLLNGRERSNHC